MAVIGTARSFHKKFKFVVEIDGFQHAGFQKCSELSVEVANVQYFEGGSLIPNKSPGRLTFADVTLDRGATRDHDLFRSDQTSNLFDGWFIAPAAAFSSIPPRWRRASWPAPGW